MNQDQPTQQTDDSEASEATESAWTPAQQELEQRDRRIAAVLRQQADELDSPPPPGEPTDADVIVGFHGIDLAGAKPRSPADNLGKLREHQNWPEVRQVLAARGMHLSTNGRGPVNEIAALARVRQIVEDLGPAGLDVVLALLRPFAGEGIATGRKIGGDDLTKARKLVAAMLAGPSSRQQPLRAPVSAPRRESQVLGPRGAERRQVPT